LQAPVPTSLVAFGLIAVDAIALSLTLQALNPLSRLGWSTSAQVTASATSEVACGR
jgi:hypothetical protein